jgi:hypothetical protein
MLGLSLAPDSTLIPAREGVPNEYVGVFARKFSATVTHDYALELLFSFSRICLLLEFVQKIY